MRKHLELTDGQVCYIEGENLGVCKNINEYQDMITNLDKIKSTYFCFTIEDVSYQCPIVSQNILFYINKEKDRNKKLSLMTRYFKEKKEAGLE